MAKKRSYTPEALQRVTALKQGVEADVRTIAERLAQHEGAEKVLCSHVDAAFSALRSLGLQRTRWYRSVTFEATIGGALTTGAGLVPLLKLPDGATIAVCTLLGVAGIGFVIHAWMRGRF